MPPTSRPVFDSYALPRPQRREGPAAALSLVVHVAIALLVLWRGAALFEGGGGGGAGPRGGGGGAGRPAVSWFALPTPSSPQAEALPPAPAVTVPTVAPVTARVKIDRPAPTLVLMTPPAAVVGTGDGTTGGTGQGPGSAGGTGTGSGTGTGADAGPGSGGGASDIFGPTPLLVPNVPAGAPPEEKKKHEVRFWIRADGRVTRIEVSPPIRDPGYRRLFMDTMWNFVFSPAKTRDGRPIDYQYSIVVYP